MGQCWDTVQFAASPHVKVKSSVDPLPWRGSLRPRFAGERQGALITHRRSAALTAALAAVVTAASRGRCRRRQQQRWRPWRTAARSAVGGQGGAADQDGFPLWPQLLLVVVAALYGSLGICLRGLYSLPGPPTPAALSLVRQFLTVLIFIPMLSWGSGDKGQSQTGDSSGGGKSKTTTALPSGFWKAALELAFWNLGNQGLTNVGLLLTGAARASFFTQLSVVITPAIAALSGQRVPPAVWGGCAVALSGVLLLGTDGSTSTDSFAQMLFSGFNLGDVFCLGSAAAWSAYIFRLGVLSRQSLPSVPLQGAKTALLCVLYLVWAIVDWQFKGCSLGALWPGFLSPVAWAILLFSAIGPGALGDIWMQRASDRLSPATANVLLALEPLFAAAFAGVLLGERLGERGLMGAGLIFAAAILVGSSDKGSGKTAEEDSRA